MPFVIAIGFELFVFPIDAFTFRSWEALAVHRLKAWLPGPFYPERRLEKVEEGDLGHGTPYAFPRRVVWMTDDFGFRHHPQSTGWPQVVLVGDSNVAGSALSQEEMLDSILEKKIGVPVYAYAPRELDAFLADQRFANHWPRVVIYIVSEVSFQAPLVTRDVLPRRPADLSSNHEVRALVVLADRLWRANMLHFWQTRAENLLGDIVARASGHGRFRHRQVLMAGDRSMLYRRYDVLEGGLSEGQIADRVRELQQYQAELARRGTILVVFPVPTKSSVYYRSVPMNPSDAITRLGRACAQAGIPLVSALVSFRHAAEAGHMLYFIGDTHWNPEGVGIAAELLARTLSTIMRTKSG